LSRALVKLPSYGIRLTLGEPGQISETRVIPPEQVIGVLVGATLPRAVGVAEVDLYSCVDRETNMLGHLFSVRGLDVIFEPDTAALSPRKRAGNS
jgi:hypothetical protein